MSFNYANSKATADRLLAQFGRTVTLRRVAQSAYDDDTSTVTLATTDVSVTAVLVGISDHERAGNPAILAGDRRALIAVGALASPPVVGDRLVVDGAEWQVIAAEPVSPAGVDVLYKTQIRR